MALDKHIAFGTAALATALAFAAPSSAASPHAAAAVRVTASDADATIHVRLGQPVMVTVGAATDGGYGWHLVPSPGIVQVGKVETAIPPASAAHLVGRPTTQTITIKATSKGRRIVDFWEGRPWEAGRPPLKTLSFVLDVS